MINVKNEMHILTGVKFISGDFYGVKFIAGDFYGVKFISGDF